MYRILVSDKIGDAGLELLDQADDVKYELKTQLSKEELLAILPEYDALIIRSGTKVDEEVIDAGKKLKIVARAGIGVDNVDIRAATLRGIVVMNTPTANSVATAEQTMALMLAISRHTANSHLSVGKGEWRRSDFVGRELYRKNLGIIGFGRIGRLVAERAQAFGMEILAYDPYVSEEVGFELGVSLVELDDLLAQSDYITLHSVVTPETVKMINAETLNMMKDSVIIVNVARGKLIDEIALVNALESGKIRGAALDVYSEEPPKDNPLIGAPNILHTSHLGASTFEAQRAVATQIVEQVLDGLRSQDFRNAVNMPFRTGPDYPIIHPHMELAEKIGLLQAAMAPKSINKIEVEVRGELVDMLVKPVAAALLKGILQRSIADPPVNYISAPVLAEENGILISQTKGMAIADYPNLISSKVYWEGGQRLMGGVLFGGTDPRIVQVDEHHVDANPDGILLIMKNQDKPGVIGQAGTIFAKYNVNVGEWRMGRHAPGSEALSFISLDSEPPPEVLQQLRDIEAVTDIELIVL